MVAARRDGGLFEHSMPRYFFHVDDGEFIPDHEGVELPDLAAAQSEAVAASGAMLQDLDGEFWKRSSSWQMHVTDEADQLLFTLQFFSKITAGNVTYRPARNAEDEADSA
jgi:hypothetical protein